MKTVNAAARRLHGRAAFCLLAAAAIGGCRSGPPARPPNVDPEARAVAFLQREVPAWSVENGCFSCHNNGDAARALYVATRHGHAVSEAALAATTAWLVRPGDWAKNQGDPGFNDQRLANLQFAAALKAAFETGYVSQAAALEVAAEKVAADQDASGAWSIEPGNAVGSPATYGTTVATLMAVRTLEGVKTPAAGAAVRKAEHWLSTVTPDNVPAAATLLLAASPHSPRRLDLPVEESLRMLRRAQTGAGGWGPYADAPSEVFDTALVLLALAEWVEADGVRESIQRGRTFLIAQQNPKGSWPETTRPTGSESYAQRVSTTAWALLALLATKP